MNQTGTNISRLIAIVVAAVLLALPPDSFAQVPKVSLIVCDPGSEIYELEGHAALRLNSTAQGGDDITVNWGLFDFNTPNFVYRFVKGETDYMAGAIPTYYFVASYAAAGRGVREYPIDLTDEQALVVDSLVRRNLLPANRVYRYNYVRDNCSLRPVAIVERALADTLPLGQHPLFGAAPTFRQAMRHYHANYPWYQFGIDLALGTGIDQREDGRAMSFAPAALADMLEHSGMPYQQLAPAGAGGPLGPTPWPLRPLTVCWTFFAITALITVRDLRRHRVTRWFDSAFYALAGLAGCLVFFLIFVSEHEATSPNWIGLWLNPFALIMAVGIWLKKSKCVLIPYQIANFGALIALLAIWIAGVQSLNSAFLPLILCDMARSASYLVNTKWSNATN